ncbi:unnamed protein product [Caenorhabditis bovis]|uniref:Uncharacterized protein n=1 Tax=Caenorhabditis bovis TaxID=2654633 RepID=A0A8S1FEB5_9PELO|nr:unnamed protein product [Caenorhabditis bovis]
MESIDHGDVFNPSGHHNIPNEYNHEQLLRPPRITLRTLSKSDPHLDIPHLLVSQDDAHPSLNKILGNLQHVHEGLKTPVASHPNLQALRQEHENPEKSSSAALLAQDTILQPPIRKSSSAIDWNGAVVEATRKASRQFDWQTALFENNRKPSFTNLGLFNTSTSSSAGGLVMSSFDNKQKEMSVVAAAQAQAPTQTPFTQTAPSSSSSATTTTAPATVAPAPPPAPQQQSTGMFGGMFHRGFFSKPVIRSDEENYRYLLALDR